VSEIVAELRNRVQDVAQARELARRAGHPYEVHLHSARLAELVEIAQRHGITVDEWVDRSVLPAAGKD
jgi:hypothetical protein